MIERRRIWTDALLADYIRDELGFPGARQGAMVEKESVDLATGEVSRERWYLLTSLGSRQWGPSTTTTASGWRLHPAFAAGGAASLVGTASPFVA